MKKILFLLLLLLAIIECKTKFIVEVHYFDEYDYNSQIHKKDAMVYKILKLSPNELNITFEGDNFIDRYNEKIINNNYIYRKFNGEYLPYYPIDSIGHELTRTDVKQIHLFFPNVIFTGEKKYKISKKEYTVLRFTEYYNDIGMRSYYLKDFGFIAFDLSNGRYFRITSCNIKDELNSKNVAEITQKLVQDTSFFSIYQFKKN
jgi:hypothetical protein